MGHKSTLTAGQKASIRYYSGQGEGPSGIAGYTGIPPYKIQSYLNSLQREGKAKNKGRGNGSKPRAQQPEPKTYKPQEMPEPELTHPTGAETTVESMIRKLLDQGAADPDRIAAIVGTTVDVVGAVIKETRTGGVYRVEDSRLVVDRGPDFAEPVQQLPETERVESVSEAVQPRQSAEEAQRAVKPRARERILELLRGGRNYGTRIAKETGTNQSHVSGILNALAAQGLVKRYRERGVAYFELVTNWEDNEAERAVKQAADDKEKPTKETGIEGIDRTILGLLSEGELYLSQLLREGNLNRETARRHLDALVKRGFLVAKGSDYKNYHYITDRGLEALGNKRIEKRRQEEKPMEGNHRESWPKVLGATRPNTIPAAANDKERERGMIRRRGRNLRLGEDVIIDNIWNGGVHTVAGISQETSIPWHTVRGYLDSTGRRSERTWGRETRTPLGENHPPLTVEELTLAIKNSTDRGRMEEEAAEQLAQHVLNFFGYSERIIDNILEPEDRDLFYNLEDAGLMTTEREETTLYDGKEWRIHYWMFRRDRVAQLSAPVKPEVAEQQAIEETYENVPAEVWRCHGTEPVEGVHVAPELAAANVGARGAGTMSTN